MKIGIAARALNSISIRVGQEETELGRRKRQEISHA